MPNFTFIVPPSPQYPGSTPLPDRILNSEDAPDIYTTTGPLPLENGLVVTTDSIALDPNYVTEGTFDCGVFGSQG
jgi:hypothetical protein